MVLVLGIGSFATFYSLAGPGDSTAEGIVGKEIARRQKLVDDAKLNILEGDDLVDQGKFAAAIEKYYSAYTSTDDSAISQPVHTLARNRFSLVSVSHALELAKLARYEEANRALDRVLSPEVSPDHKAAAELKNHLKDPERYNPALTPKHLEAVTKVEKLFQLANGHMKLGNYDMANLTYAAILREDATNEAARRGMETADKHIAGYHKSSRDHFRSKLLSDVDKQWESQVPLSESAYEAVASLPGATNSSAISDRLRNIIVPEVEFTDETLEGVADYLTRISKDLDPSGTGVNFVLQIGQEDAALRDISVNLILRSVPLGEVVRFVTQSTNTKFRVEQFAVVITSLNSASTELVTKKFYVPPDFLNSTPAGDEGGFDEDPFGGGGGDNKSNLITLRLNAKQYLERAGVTFPPNSFATHTVSNNTLIVRNTQNNIDLVEALVSTLKKGVQQMVKIAITQVEFNMEANDELTFDQLLSHFNLPGSKSVFGSGAADGQDPNDFPFTPPNLSNIPVGQYSLTDGIRSGSYAISGNAIDGITDGDPISGPGIDKAPAFFGISAVFSDPQYQMAIRAINQRKGSSVTNQPMTVTQPGQRSVIEVLRNFPYPTEYDPPEIPQTFTQNRNDAILIDPVNQVIFFIPGQEPPNTFPVTPAHPTAFDVRNVGTRFEVEPTIDPNGYVVTLNMSVEFSQFEGFINYGTPITTTDGVVLTDNRILQPLFKVSRLAQPVHVQDGSNFVIGGIMSEDVEATQDKVPVLGDVPLVGRFFRGNVKERRRKAVLFFVKVRILDPSGQPVNRAVGTVGL